jgi:hypothetical protein
MSRKIVGASLIGWLLGISTAFAIPTLVYQRQTVLAGSTAGGVNLSRLTDDGWVIVRQDGAFFTVDRSRFRIP